MPRLRRRLNRRCARPSGTLTRQAPHHAHHAIDLLAGVVEGQRGAHRCLEAVTAQDGLCAMVAGAHGYALFVDLAFKSLEYIENTVEPGLGRRLGGQVRALAAAT